MRSCRYTRGSRRRPKWRGQRDENYALFSDLISKFKSFVVGTVAYITSIGNTTSDNPSCRGKVNVQNVSFEERGNRFDAHVGFLLVREGEGFKERQISGQGIQCWVETQSE